MSSSQSQQCRILIVGAGAIGGFYGAVLQQQGADVSVVCRSEYEVVRQHGYAIESVSLGDRHFRPAQVLKSAADYQGGPPDYLVLCVKVVEGTDRMAMIRDAVGPRTTIFLIENGVEIESEIAEAFPDNKLLSALAYIQVSRVAPGKVKHTALGELVFGDYPSGVSEQATRLAMMLSNGGIKATVSGDVVTARWNKCVWNAAFNPISILGGVLDTEDILGLPEGEALVRRAMTEICAVATATGHPLPPSLIDQYIAGTRKSPRYKTSMALDYENGRTMEIEIILGNVVRAGRREGVAIPVLETIYSLAKMVERKRS